MKTAKSRFLKVTGLVSLVVVMFVVALGVKRWQRDPGPPQKAPVFLTRVYKVDTNQFVPNLAYMTGLGSGTNLSTNVSRMVQDFFQMAGIDFRTNKLSLQQTIYNRVPANFQRVAGNFLANIGLPLVTNRPPRPQVFYNDKKGLLLFRASDTDLNVVEKSIGMLTAVPRTGSTDPAIDEEWRELYGKGSPFAANVPSDERPKPVQFPEAVDTWMFKVEDRMLFAEHLLRSSGRRAKSLEETAVQVRELLSVRGVDIGTASDGASLILYNDRNGALLVRAKRRELKSVQRIVIAFNCARASGEAVALVPTELARGMWSNEWKK